MGALKCLAVTTILEGGEWWCGIHAPSRKLERAEARARKNAPLVALREASDACHDAMQELIAAVEKHGLYVNELPHPGICEASDKLRAARTTHKAAKEALGAKP